MATWLDDLREAVGDVTQDVLDAAAMYDKLTGQTTAATPSIAATQTATTPTTVTAASDTNTILIVAAVAAILFVAMR